MTINFYCPTNLCCFSFTQPFTHSTFCLPNLFLFFNLTNFEYLKHLKVRCFLIFCNPPPPPPLCTHVDQGHLPPYKSTIDVGLGLTLFKIFVQHCLTDVILEQSINFACCLFQKQGGSMSKCELREIQCLVCSTLHQMFITDPKLAKLVHFQV